MEAGRPGADSRAIDRPTKDGCGRGSDQRSGRASRASLEGKEIFYEQPDVGNHRHNLRSGSAGRGSLTAGSGERLDHRHREHGLHGGWICSNTGMWRMRAAGTGKWGRAVLQIQLVGLVLAFMFGLFEAMGLLGRDSIIFNITDAAWPLSMLWMLVVGATVIVAKRPRLAAVRPGSMSFYALAYDPRLDCFWRHHGRLCYWRFRRTAMGPARLYCTRQPGASRDARARRQLSVRRAAHRASSGVRMRAGRRAWDPPSKAEGIEGGRAAGGGGDSSG